MSVTERITTRTATEFYGERIASSTVRKLVCEICGSSMEWTGTIDLDRSGWNLIDGKVTCPREGPDRH